MSIQQPITAFVPAGAADPAGAVALLVKRTWEITDSGIAPSAEQLVLDDADFYDDPASPLNAEVLAQCDMVAGKPLTDVVVIADACAPRGRAVLQLDCSVTVGPLRKTVRVFGDRHVRSGALGAIRIGDPEPFTSLALGYRRAFGGIARTRDGGLFAFPPNPIGCGWSIRGAVDAAEVRVPNQEDPLVRLDVDTLFARSPADWSSAPKPVSLGWTRRDFYPRYTYAGVPSEQLPTATANRDALAAKYPSLATMAPPVMNPLFYQGASEGLCGGPLRGDEAVRLEHLDPQQPLVEFELPGALPVCDVVMSRRTLQPRMQLATVVIDMRRRLLSMCWSGICDGLPLRSLGQVKAVQCASK